MATVKTLTTGQLARAYGCPLWVVRMVIDNLGVEIPRAGLYRLVPEELLPAIEAELVKRGYQRREAQAHAG